jgi:hypothetical protein
MQNPTDQAEAEASIPTDTTVSNALIPTDTTVNNDLIPTDTTVTNKTRKQEWEDNYNEVAEFGKTYGHLNLPDKDANTRRLAKWLNRQKKRKDVHNHQREKLVLLYEYGYEVDSIWVPKDEKYDAVWNANFDKLLEYKKEHDGSFVVAKNDKDNQKLYTWIVSQRYKERRDRLSPDKRKRLVDDGFEFRRCKPLWKKRRYTEKQEKKWDEMYAKLCSYHEEYGHCIVKYHDENYEALANWVSLQRLNYRQGLMDKTRQQRLHDLNFTWSIQPMQSRQES